MRLFVLYFWCSNGILINGLEPLLCLVKQSKNSNKSKKPIQVNFFGPHRFISMHSLRNWAKFCFTPKRLALANVLFCFVEQCCQTKGRRHFTMQGYMILMMKK